jgi:hypothetical protein
MAGKVEKISGARYSAVFSSVFVLLLNKDIVFGYSYSPLVLEICC